MLMYFNFWMQDMWIKGISLLDAYSCFPHFVQQMSADVQQTSCLPVCLCVVLFEVSSQLL